MGMLPILQPEEVDMGMEWSLSTVVEEHLGAKCFEKFVGGTSGGQMESRAVLLLSDRFWRIDTRLEAYRVLCQTVRPM